MRCITALFLALFISSCIDEPVLEESRPNLPENLSQQEAIQELGRVLFYDNKLSVNNSISCSSCHKQELAFSDSRQFSLGFDNRPTNRNSLPIQNLLVNNGFFRNELSSIQGGFFSQGLFWDGRESNVNEMVLMPIVNHVEMGVGNLDDLCERLGKIDYYQELFRMAYENNDITPENISHALVAFLSSIQTNETKLDRFHRGESSLNALELTGKFLFENIYECNGCHSVETPNGYLSTGGFTNIGLESTYQDIGREALTGNLTDHGVFKISSLRNISVTGPYMHDGRFETLDEVLDHYSNGIQQNNGLDFRLIDSEGNPKRFNITEEDKQAIKAFLGTLTDWKMLTNPKLSDPFK